MEQEKYILFVYFYSQLELHSNSIVSNTNVLYILTILTKLMENYI
jgi:hypothetical protein